MCAMAGVGQAGHDRGQDRVELNRASGLVAILTQSFASYFHLSRASKGVAVEMAIQAAPGVQLRIKCNMHRRMPC